LSRIISHNRQQNGLLFPIVKQFVTRVVVLLSQKYFDFSFGLNFIFTLQIDDFHDYFAIVKMFARAFWTKRKFDEQYREDNFSLNSRS